MWFEGRPAAAVRRPRRAQGLLPEKKVFEVHIEQGHKYGAKVVLRGEAGCSDPSVQPGDVVFVLEQRPHKLFKRVGTTWSWIRCVPARQACCCPQGCFVHVCKPQASGLSVCCIAQGPANDMSPGTEVALGCYVVPFRCWQID